MGWSWLGFGVSTVYVNALFHSLEMERRLYRMVTNERANMLGNQ